MKLSLFIYLSECKQAKCETNRNKNKKRTTMNTKFSYFDF